MTTQSPPWPPKFASVNCRLKPNTASFQSPLTGAMQVSARPGDQWLCDIKFPPMEQADFEANSAWLTRAMSRGEAVYLSDYRRPRNYTSGVDGALTCDSTAVKCDSTAYKADTAFSYGNPCVNGASQTGRSLVTGGWNASATIYAGMMLSFYNGTFEELHKVETTVTADSSGAATISIIPPIRRSPSDVAEIKIDGKATAETHRCKGEFLIAPGSSYGWVIDPVLNQIEDVSAVEFIR